MEGIKGKVAFITGAEKGLGKEIATNFAKRQANVVIFGIDETCGKATEEELKNFGVKALFINGSVTSDSDLKNAVDKTITDFGGLDFAVNCAGIATAITAINDHSEEDFDNVMGVNLKGVFLSMKHQLEFMKKSGKGKIVNITSAVGQVGNKGLSLYSSSKHAVNGMT
jgi:NAD(P)-dependent dehydrogenase (short-subunit alcohol dehydrogenase family)